MGSQDAPAGPRRQHFIPCFLLRRFASRARRDRHYVYLFRRGDQPREVNVRNVAVFGHFYEDRDQDQGPCSLEVKLQHHENGYATLVQDLCAASSTRAEKSGDRIAAFLAHLIERTKHRRDSFAELADAALVSCERDFAREEHRAELERSLVAKLLAHPQFSWLNLVPSADREAFARELLRATGIDFPSIMAAVIREIRGQNDVPGRVRSAHIRLLDAHGMNVARFEMFKSLRWSVAEYEPGTFILGDIGPLAQFDRSSDFESPTNYSNPCLVVLPLDNERLLVGQTGNEPERVVEAEAVNIASAELSREFFLASRATDAERHYLSRLG